MDASQERELYLKHLDIIQTRVSRMAQNSFFVKFGSITLTGGISAFMRSQEHLHVTQTFLPVIMTVLLFWGLDAYCVRQERLFSQLYNAVIAKLNGQASDAKLKPKQKNTDISPLSMNTDLYDGPSWFRTLFSITVWPLPVFIIGIMIAISSPN